MTAVKTLAGEKLLIQIGDGASPETFAADCLINLDRSFALTADVSDTVVPDCDDPSSAGFKERFIDGLSGDITGSGVLHTDSIDAWFNWLVSAAAKNIRVKIDTTALAGGGYFAAAFKLSSFKITGTRKNNSTCEVSLVSHGTITWVPLST